jgi:hypothetical protein
MRCRRVGANVSPMRGMLSPVLMLIKPALLSHCGLATTHAVSLPTKSPAGRITALFVRAAVKTKKTELTEVSPALVQ